MAYFIELTYTGTAKRVWLCASHITSIGDGNGCTRIRAAGILYEVQESREAVMAKLQEAYRVIDEAT